MKIGVISDIHSNIEALNAVIRFFKEKEVTQIFCCGDIVGYGPDPGLCIETLQRERIRTVAGNHEWGVLGLTRLERFNRLAQMAIRWTQRRLTQNQMLFLENLSLVFDFGPVHLVHASPAEPAEWEYIFTVADAEDQMRAFIQNICFVGHSHTPLVAERTPHSGTNLLSQRVISVRQDAKYIVNVGSVGQPRDGDPRSCCVVVDLNEHQIEFHRVEYDFSVTQKKIIAAGLPEELAQRLSVGR